MIVSANLHFYLHWWLIARIAVSGVALAADIAIIQRTASDRSKANPQITTHFEAWSLRWAPWQEAGVAVMLALLLLSALSQDTARHIAVVFVNQFSLLGCSVVGCARGMILLYARRRGQHSLFSLDEGKK